jgi:hypothetical protein
MEKTDGAYPAMMIKAINALIANPAVLAVLRNLGSHRQLGEHAQ